MKVFLDYACAGKYDLVITHGGRAMNKLSTQKRASVIAALVEGVGINGACRMTGVAKHTVLALLAQLGTACARYQDEQLRGLRCERLQCDEIWAFCYAKQKNIPEEFRGRLGFGDTWTWVAIDADTKLVPSFLVGERSLEYAVKFIEDLASRLAHRVQLTTDGLTAYLEAVEGAFGHEIDYAMLQKLYASPPTEGRARYSPAECCGTRTHRVSGHPEGAQISTSYVERQNLTMRMHMRRFTRLTNGFSKKIENHAHAVALYFMYYNFAKVHSTLRVTPAMEAGVSDHVWTLEEIVSLLESR
jgi:IS1 family transposase